MGEPDPEEVIRSDRGSVTQLIIHIVITSHHTYCYHISNTLLSQAIIHIIISLSANLEQFENLPQGEILQTSTES